MKTIARRISAAIAAVTAIFASLFIAAPALASGEEGERVDQAALLSTAGGAPDVVAILVTAGVVLLVVLLTAGKLSSLFVKRG